MVIFLFDYMFLKHTIQFIFLTKWNLTLNSVQEREVFAFCQKEHIHYIGCKFSLSNCLPLQQLLDPDFQLVGSCLSSPICNINTCTDQTKWLRFVYEAFDTQHWQVKFVNNNLKEY